MNDNSSNVNIYTLVPSPIDYTIYRYWQNYKFKQNIEQI